LSKNEIASIEIDSFLTDTLESNIIELILSMNKLKTIKFGQFNGLPKLERLFIDENQIEKEKIKKNKKEKKMSVKDVLLQDLEGEESNEENGAVLTHVEEQKKLKTI
jgi:Leucine-rich repeat (LRR) protein